MRVDFVLAGDGEPRDVAEARAEERLLDLLLPPLSDDWPAGRARVGPEDLERRARTREKFRSLLRQGRLDDREVEIEKSEPGSLADFMNPSVFDSAMRVEIRRMLSRIDEGGLRELEARVSSALPERTRRIRVTVAEARNHFIQQETSPPDGARTIISPATTLAVPEPAQIVVVQESLLRLLRGKPELVYEISHRQFEELVYELFARLGYEVELTAQTRDGGADIIAFSQDNLGIRTKYVVEAKHYAPRRRIGVGVVRQVNSVRQKMGAHHGIIVTSSFFTADATRENLEYYGLHLKDHDHLMEWIRSA